MITETKKELRRILSKKGVASRKDSEEIIISGRVSVDGKIIKNPLEPVYMSQDIFLDGKEIQNKELIYYAFNKPKGVVTSMNDDLGRRDISSFMPTNQYLFPVGRLDKNSRGLILFTNDNHFSDELMSPQNKIEKIYRVQVKGKFIDKHIEELKRGIFIDKQRHSAKVVRILKTNPKSVWLEITLTEGKNRQIRKMLETLNYDILELVRVKIGKLSLRKLGITPGEYIVIKKEWVI